MPASVRQPEAPSGPVNERFIPGIHHYCNRLVQRCEVSHRCLKFVLTEEICAMTWPCAMAAPRPCFDALRPRL